MAARLKTRIQRSIRARSRRSSATRRSCRRRAWRRSRSTWAWARPSRTRGMLEAAQTQLATIAGQKPNVRRARKSVAQFKVREGMPVGLTVTLRDERAYEFVDRLTSVAIPRIRDFRGLNPALVRRPRQLLHGRPRADHLPGDRLRRDRSGARSRRRPSPRPRRPTPNQDTYINITIAVLLDHKSRCAQVSSSSSRSPPMMSVTSSPSSSSVSRNVASSAGSSATSTSSSSLPRPSPSCPRPRRPPLRARRVRPRRPPEPRLPAPAARPGPPQARRASARLGSTAIGTTLAGIGRNDRILVEIVEFAACLSDRRAWYQARLLPPSGILENV